MKSGEYYRDITDGETIFIVNKWYAKVIIKGDGFNIRREGDIVNTEMCVAKYWKSYIPKNSNFNSLYNKLIS